MSWSRLATVRSSFRRLAEYTSASCVRAQKSRYRPIRLRSQLYSSCFVLHICASCFPCPGNRSSRSEEHTSELQSLAYLVCRLLLEKKRKDITVTSEEHTSEVQSIDYIL